MTQINKYTDRGGYAADTARLATRSAVSLIENESAAVCDGVNVAVGKAAADVGDLAVFDRADGVIRYVRGATLRREQLPENLVPLAVVYARQGERVLVVSLENATCNGLASIRWAASYEVALTGFDLAKGGTARLTFGTGTYAVELPVTYAAGASLEDLAAQINADKTVNKTYGWTASADAKNARIVLMSNTGSPDHAAIDVVSGCRITRTPEDKNYQTTLTGMLIEGAIDYVRRRNGCIQTYAGGNSEIFYQYYSVNGNMYQAQKPGSVGIVRESAFTQADNPELVAAYPTYRDYLLGEHMMQYPGVYGAALRSGKSNTEKIGGLRFVDIHGENAPCYPAAAAALGYGVAVEGAATGLEPGAWWLPSVDEMYLLMRDRATGPGDSAGDAVNRTLSRIGKVPLYASGYYSWTSCECSFNNAYAYHGGTGYVGNYGKYGQVAVRPVSIL